MFGKVSLRNNFRAAGLSAVGLASFVSAVMFVAAPLQAGNVYWTLPAGRSGDWSTASNWGGTLPTGNDLAFVDSGGQAVITKAGETCNYLVLAYNSSADSGTVNMISGGLSATQQYIGYSGTGTITQSGGTNSGGDLVVGFNAGSGGTYNLSGNGQLVANLENVGGYGRGIFIQSGGTNSSGGNIQLGYSNSSGTYSLSGSGVLSVTNDELVGLSGTGSFTQSGGSNSCGTFDLGSETGGSGTYSFSGGFLSVSDNASIGYVGTGAFTQTGGTYSIGGWLNLANQAGSAGTCKLSGSGYLAVAGVENVGYSGTSSFTQSGGTNSCGYFNLGAGTGGSGTYSFSGGFLSVSNNASIGYVGTGTFLHTGGTNNINNWLNIGNQAGSIGAYNLSGSGYLAVASVENVGSSGTGTFTQSGGTNSCGELILGTTTFGSGTYNLNGGLTVLSSLSQGSGSAMFNFSGGTLQASSGFPGDLPMTLGTSGGGATFDTAGYSVSLSGSLSGPGSLTLNDSLGAGMLILSVSNTYTGGTTVRAGTLQLGDASALGSISGSLHVAGGVLDLAGNDVAVGKLSGEGTVDISSGTADLSVGNGDGSSTFAGTIENTAGVIALTKTGSGTLILAGSNLFTGGTDVEQGKLIVANVYGLEDGTDLTVGNAGLFAPAIPVTPAISPVPEPGTLALIGRGRGSICNMSQAASAV